VEIAVRRTSEVQKRCGHPLPSSNRNIGAKTAYIEFETSASVLFLLTQQFLKRSLQSFSISSKECVA
jgi:hypothetical protein